MTCIVGLVSNNKIYLGSDSRATAGNHVVPSKVNKIFKKNDEIMMGIAGYVRVSDVLRSLFIVPPKPESKTDLDYLQVEFVNSIRACLESVKIIINDSGMAMMGDSSMILVYKNKLYNIDNSFSVMEFPEYTCIGSGQDYAYGSLETTSKMKVSGRKRVELALEAACKFDTGCALPFNVIEKTI